MAISHIAQVRSFNRAVTQRVGALADSYLARGRPLSEARLVHEIGAGQGAELNQLRRRLSIDSAYLSRLLRSLEAQGLVELKRSASDGRARIAELTPAARVEYEAYEAGSDALAAAILSPLDDARRDRLVAAMADVERLLRAAAVEVELADIGDADVLRCLNAYYDELGRRFEAGFDPDAGKTFDPAEMIPPKGWVVLARLDDEAVGCGALKRLDASTGEIKRVWTAPSARGLGVASRLMQRLEQIAAGEGFYTLRLDTNRALKEAQAMYRASGWREIGRYNDNPYADHFFEKRL